MDRDGARGTGYHRDVAVSLFSLAPRVVAIATSGMVHATLFASLVFTSQGHASPPTETVIAIETLETLEELPAPVVSRPVETALNPVAEPETHQHPYPVPPSHDAHPHDPSLVHVATPSADTHEPAAPPEPIAAAPEAPARFTIVLSPASGRSAAASAGGGPGTGSDGVGAAGPAADPTYAENTVSSRAKLLASATASYPPAARSAEVEADVPVEIVVDTRGVVVDAHVVTRAGYGFDDSALTAIRSYRFSPAQRDGHAVRVRMRWSVQFRLR